MRRRRLEGGRLLLEGGRLLLVPLWVGGLDGAGGMGLWKLAWAAGVRAGAYTRQLFG